MESFYGGRQGISFIIVKRFDGINIPKDTSFTVKYFAFDTSENNFILDENNNPIERTNDTYKLYNDWKLHEKDGSSIIYKEKEGVFPFQYAEGMVQCFSQGGITTDIVNYGEYVIIDTPNKNDLDNGKVYRRGLDYQNDLGGAEYIGQIIGPTGSSPEIYMDSFTALVDEGGPQISYENDDIIPGMELDADGQMIFNDAIHSSWVTLRDEYGNITGCKIGFQFPYHVFNFTAEGVSPYTTGELIERIDDKQHPYFSKWKISVPKGIKGDALTNLHIVNGSAKKGAKYYQDIDCTIQLGTLTQETAIEIENENYTEEASKGKPILYSNTIRYVKEVDTYREILIYKEINFDQRPEGDIKYIILGDYNIIKNITLADDGTLTIEYTHSDTKTYNKKIKWITNVDFDRDNGQIIITFNTGVTEILNQQDNEKIKWIDNIYLDTDGKLKVKYNIDNNEYIINQNTPVQWINNINLTSDGKVEVTYNTQPQPIVINSNNVLKWINNITFNDNEGIIKVSYNTNPQQSLPLNTTPIKWIIDAKLTDNGDIVFKYNTDPAASNGNVVNTNDKIRWIKHDDNTGDYGIQINTNATKIENGQEIDLGEGTGSQKIQVTYNTGEKHEIGRPINYIIESVVTKDRELLGNAYRDTSGRLKPEVAKGDHLLVLYSDPEYRQKLYDDGKCKIWKSSKLNQDNDGYFEQWYDLGEVRGEPGTVRIVTTITPQEAETVLVDNNTPEIIFGHDKFEGWLVGVHDPALVEEPIILYYYDYDRHKWKELGSVLAPEVPVKPETVVQIESSIAADQSNITIADKGIIFTKDTQENVIKDLRQKNDGNFSNPFYFSSFAKYITPTLNAGVDTLEQQLLIGFNTITEEWIDELGDIHTKTKFLIDETTPEYYILHSVIYVGTNIVNNIVKKDTLSIYKDNVETNILEKEISQSINEQGIKITREKIIKF